MIPARKIQVLASMLHVTLDQPRNRRHVAVPGPSRILGVAIDAGMTKNNRYWRGNVCAQQQWRAGSI
jgi:hypothetical protein